VPAAVRLRLRLRLRRGKVADAPGTARLGQTAPRRSLSEDGTARAIGPREEVPCDQSVVQQRITAHKPVRVDVDGAKGSTGVLAWRIDAI
jgi:hypothetical protein